MAAPVLRVGLTGGLACGKSTVLKIFAELGAGTIDADAIVHGLMAPGSPLVDRIQARFGVAVRRPDGSLDRARLATIVFADPSLRRDLEHLVHPEVLRHEEREARRQIATGVDLLVVDIPLLFEAGQVSRFARVVVVRCDPEDQLARAIARGMDPDDARRRIDAQMPLDDKARRADYVIDTSTTLEQTRQRTLAVHRLLCDDLGELRAAGRLPQRRWTPGRHSSDLG